MFFRPRNTYLELGRPFLADADRVVIDVLDDSSDCSNSISSHSGSLLSSTQHCIKLLSRTYHAQRYRSHFRKWWKPLLAVMLLLGLEGFILWRLISKMILQDHLIDQYNQTAIPGGNQTCKDLFFVAEKEAFCKKNPPVDFFEECSNLLDEICRLNKMAAEAVILAITTILLMIEWGHFKTGKFHKIPHIDLSYDAAFVSDSSAGRDMLVTANKLGIPLKEKSLQVVFNEFKRKVEDVNQGYARVLIKRMNCADDIERLIFDFADLNTNVKKRLALVSGLHKRAGKGSQITLLSRQSKLTRTYLLNSIFDYAGVSDAPMTERTIAEMESKQSQANSRHLKKMQAR
jgi:hypothetical protein